MSDRSHALVVGGTGMLRGVSLHLAEHGCTVSVVARRMQRLRSLEEAAEGLPGRIVPLALDYRDSAALRDALTFAQREHGALSLAVCWIHSVAPEALDVVAEAVAAGTEHCRLIHVLGSAGADPTLTASRAEERFARSPALRYRQVMLGFVVENGRSRWLTDAEISRGVIAAIEQDRPRSTVGTVEPWSARP